ncbi:MAG: polysaccharide pyruvyl transferase family protein, partial [Lachnospiraceae bacterium]|nr:polysaccharide pyruvyl transferase family protein [Lachnospiraceae bacterium]
PDKKGYVFMYMTEGNDTLAEYAKELARRKGISILKVKGGPDMHGENVCVDHTAGPAEFIGYIHEAEYVVTNSFHGVAFSIIFQKDFVAFQHSRVGARISNILEMCGLEDRLYKEDMERKAGIRVQERARTVNWDNVEKRIEEKVKVADRYLMNGLKE